MGHGEESGRDLTQHWVATPPFLLTQKKTRERCEADLWPFFRCDLLVFKVFFATTDALTTIFQFVFSSVFFLPFGLLTDLIFM